jgi:hypothetical protein
VTELGIGTWDSGAEPPSGSPASRGSSEVSQLRSWGRAEQCFASSRYARAPQEHMTLNGLHGDPFLDTAMAAAFDDRLPCSELLSAQLHLIEAKPSAKLPMEEEGRQVKARWYQERVQHYVSAFQRCGCRSREAPQLVACGQRAPFWVALGRRCPPRTSCSPRALVAGPQLLSP